MDSESQRTRGARHRWHQGLCVAPGGARCRASMKKPSANWLGSEYCSSAYRAPQASDGIKNLNESQRQPSPRRSLRQQKIECHTPRTYLVPRRTGFGGVSQSSRRQNTRAGAGLSGDSTDCLLMAVLRHFRIGSNSTRSGHSTFYIAVILCRVETATCRS
jgi:hypothetical protein